MIGFLHCAGRGKAICTLIGSAVLLTACGTTSKQTFDLTSIYMTPAAAGEYVRKPQRKVQILVTNPEALKALDGQDIVVQSGYGAISYLKGAQWGDRLPSMVQAQLIRALEDSGRLGGVGRPGEGLAIDYLLITDIRTFNIEAVAGNMVAHVKIAAKILNDKTGNVRSMQVFSAQVPVNGRNNADYANALDEAFARVRMDIVNWTLLNN